MCTYGIGLPFDHPIWRNLPPCQCGVKFGPSWDQRLDYIRHPAVTDRWLRMYDELVRQMREADEPDPTALIYDPSDAPVATQ